MGFALSDMQFVSSAFENGGAIPREHTGEGDDVRIESEVIGINRLLGTYSR